jgi:hypothetical protein
MRHQNTSRTRTNNNMRHRAANEPAVRNAERLSCRRDRRRPKFRDQPQDVGEQIPRDDDLRHIKRDIATVAHDFRADFDQLLFEARYRLILCRLGRRQGTQRIAEIGGERMKLKPNGVGGECAA